MVAEITDTDATASYIRSKSPVYPGLEGRIIFENSNDASSASMHKYSNYGVLFPVVALLSKFQ